MNKLDDIKQGYLGNLGKPSPRAKGTWCVVDLGVAEIVALNDNAADVGLLFPNASIVSCFEDSDDAYDYAEEHRKPVHVTNSKRYWSMIVFFNECK